MNLPGNHSAPPGPAEWRALADEASRPSTYHDRAAGVVVAHDCEATRQVPVLCAALLAAAERCEQAERERYEEQEDAPWSVKAEWAEALRLTEAERDAYRRDFEALTLRCPLYGAAERRVDRVAATLRRASRVREVRALETALDAERTRAETAESALADERATTARYREALQQLLGEVAELGYDREDEERAYRDEEEAERGEHPDVLVGTIPWEGIWKARVVLAAPTDPPAAGDPGKCGGGQL